MKPFSTSENAQRAIPISGVSKLARLLYYSDCAAYILLGKPITGTTYIHFPHGPYPENWYQARMKMEQSGAVTVLRDSQAQGYHRYGLLTNRPANREMLAPEEIEEMDAQLERFADYSAAAIEDYSPIRSGLACHRRRAAVGLRAGRNFRPTPEPALHPPRDESRR